VRLSKEKCNTCAIYEAPKEVETLNGKSKYFLVVDYGGEVNMYLSNENGVPFSKHYVPDFEGIYPNIYECIKTFKKSVSLINLFDIISF